jgi:hypothetical protein
VSALISQELNTIPIQYYFIDWAGGIQDRNGIDSEKHGKLKDKMTDLQRKFIHHFDLLWLL